MKNNDTECFKWCIARALNPKYNHHERITKELTKLADKLNWSGIPFPVSYGDINKFERNNVKISVNVVGYGTNNYPSRISKHDDRKYIIDLLLISNEPMTTV